MLTLDTLNRALLLENIHPDATARLTKAGYQVETVPRALGEDELIAKLQGVSLLGIRSQTHVTERVVAAAPDLLAVGAFCIGTNQVDLGAAARRAAFGAFDDILTAALSRGGTVTGEHGIGLLKRGGMRQELDPGVQAMQRAVKHALDPQDLFNPGKVVGEP